MRHHTLRGRHGNIPKRDNRNRSEKFHTVASDARDEHSDRTEKLTNIERRFFAETFDHSSSQERGDRARADANNHERKTGGSFAPGVAINGVEHPNAKNVVRGVSEKLNNRESPQLRVRAQQNEGTHGIGPA